MVALVTFATACGEAAGTASPSPSPSPAIKTPIASPSPSSPAFEFKLNGIKTPASGTITVTSAPPKVSIQLVITGLQPNSSHISHIHLGTCTQNGGIAFALNQVIADGQGDANAKTTLTANYPPKTGHWYVVVHAGPDMNGSNATYLLCGNASA